MMALRSILKKVFVLSLLSINVPMAIAQNPRLPLAQPTDLCFPESTLRFYADDKDSSGGLDRAAYDEVIAFFEGIVAPVVKEKVGKKLIITSDWDNARVNAHATKDDQDNLVIVVDGGMPRHPEMTADGLLLILCHELGHHFGGAPRQFRGRSNLRSWSSAEGQADYFAATKCLPTLFRPVKEEHHATSNRFSSLNSMNKMNKEDEFVAAQKRCQDELCVRMAFAGLSVSRVFASLKSYPSWPSLQIEDMAQVLSTNYGHPSPQCRLDTIVSGANCQKQTKIDFDPTNPKIGACQDDEMGARPLCWYHPEDNFK